ncbi:MAG: hypothetical protein ACTHJS_09665 [Xanthobacteraceae bacterium]|jgi:hypothetical protein
MMRLSSLFQRKAFALTRLLLVRSDQAGQRLHGFFCQLRYRLLPKRPGACQNLQTGKCSFAAQSATLLQSRHGCGLFAALAAQAAAKPMRFVPK